MQKLIPIREAAKILDVSIDTVRRYDKLGILHSTRPGGKTRYFNLEELRKVKSAKPLAMIVPTHLSKVKISLLLVKVLVMLLTILTLLFLLWPEQTAHLLTSFM